MLPYARNARTHSDAQVAQIAASILEFGWSNPVIVGNDGIIIAGHGRVMAARKLGMDEIPCVVMSHLSETQRRALVLADNKLALNAAWDDDLLSVEIQSLIDDGFKLDIIGFNQDDVDSLLGVIESGDGEMRDLTSEPSAKKLVFALTEDQREIVDRALNKASSEDKNEALAEICHAFCA